MLESLNTGVFEYEKLRPEEMKARGILGRLVGVMADTINPTRNGRSYSEKLWENVFNNPIMQERIENKCCFGELGHPLDREETDMEKIAICMDGVPKKDSDGKLQAVFNILDTPNGRILKTLCDYGCNIGISSRGSGDLVQDFDGNESVDPDTYNCEGWDAVLIPAVKEARLKYVNESLEKTRYNKSLRTRLQEAVEKADVDKKKAMTESLHTFLGEGIWDEIENSVEEPAAGPEPNEDFVDELDSNIEATKDNQDNGESLGDMFPPEDGDALDTPPEEDILDDAIESDPLADIDTQMDDLELPENNGIEYKGVSIKKDQDSGKFVCEINKETYVFNSEKNAKIWIDMNEEEVAKDSVSDEIEDIVNAEDEKNDVAEQDPESIGESLVEEQVGRDTHKDDKDADDVQHQEERKEDSEEKKDDNEVTITIKESIAFSKENVTEDEVISDFINRCKERLNEFEQTDIELEIPTSMDTDDFWYDVREACRDNGINLSSQESNEFPGGVYVYFYISRDSNYNLNESFSSDWDSLNGTEQMTVDAVIDHLNRGNSDPLDWIAQDAAAMYNEANAFMDEDEEADPKKVVAFIRNNYKTLGIDAHKINEKLEEDTLKYSEITSKEAGDTGAEVDSLQEMLEHNLELEQKIIVLQEKLSVSHAEENRLVEEVADLKDKIAKLSKVSKENKALKEKIKKVEDSSTQLNESLGKNSSKVKRLTEQLNTVIGERNTATHELESLKEEYASLEKDSQQMNEQLATKVENQNKLLEKYQKITKGAVDRYINLQATNLGVRPVEIRNKLPEKFSFSDVDSICEELRDYKLNVSKLPFATSNSLREGNVRVNNLSRGLTPKNEMDELNDIDLKLMELFK